VAEKATKPCPFCKEPIFSVQDPDDPRTTVPLDISITVWAVSSDGKRCKKTTHLADHREVCRILKGDEAKRENLELREQIEALERKIMIALEPVTTVIGSTEDVTPEEFNPTCSCGHGPTAHPDWGDSDLPCIAQACECSKYRPGEPR
jgi:hypothetical protein